MLLAKARNSSLLNLVSWSITSAPGNQAPDRRHMSRMKTAASVAVAVERIGAACTLPEACMTAGRRVLDHVEAGGRRRQSGDTVHPDYPAAQRRQRQRMEEPARAAVLCLGALARLARVHILSDVIILAHAEGQAQHQRPRLGAPKMPPERAVMAVAEHLCPPPAGMQRRSQCPVRGG